MSGGLAVASAAPTIILSQSEKK
ncbi:MAG: hypothetical protein AAGG68_29060 [Bacteroidota bacterium]